MEKTIGNKCPECHQDSMNIYYSEKSDIRVAAWCESCNSKYIYSEGKLVLLPKS